MTLTILETKSLRLVLDTTEKVRARIAAMAPEDRAQISPDWLARLEAATSPDPWVHGFSLVHRADDKVIGTGDFTGPPSDGAVEIAYGVNPDYQGRGYATEAAQAMVAFAFNSGQVRTVLAHTLPEANASTRVLTKCGFQFMGEINHPEDGRVWKWAKSNDTA